MRVLLSDCDFFDLREVMSAVGDRSDLRWVLRDAWFFGDVSPVWPEGVHQGETESDKPGGAALTWSQMSSLAESCHQIIYGRFTGYDGDSPVVELQVVDSTYWVVWARDPSVLASVRSAFPTAEEYEGPNPVPLW